MPALLENSFFCSKSTDSSRKISSRAVNSVISLAPARAATETFVHCVGLLFDQTRDREREGEGGRSWAFSIILRIPFHTIKTVDLALRKNLSNEEIADEMRKIEELASGSLPVSHPPRLSATGDRRTSELAR
jgi:hypothetical protein